MAIIIDTELFLKNTEPYRRIKWVDALEFNKLPVEYLQDSGPWVYLENDMKRLRIHNPHSEHTYTLSCGEVVTEAFFQKALQTIQQAGDRLKKIRERNLRKYEDKVGFHSYYI